MKKIVITMLLLSNLLFSQKGCKIDKKVVQKLEHIYAKEIKDLNYSFEENYKGLEKICQSLPSQDKTILALPYAIGGEGFYTLSLILAIIDNQSKTIEQSYFHKDIANSDAVYISDINIDTKNYSDIASFGLIIGNNADSRVDQYQEAHLFLYKKQLDSFSVILDNFNTELSRGVMYEYANGIFSSMSLQREKNSNLIFKQNYTYCYDEGLYEEDPSKCWKVQLDPIKLKLKNGKYKRATKTKPIFDLQEIEANAKKGLKYKEIVLRAMLYEEPIVSSTLQAYNNIAYYLQKAGHNKEAIFLLERIISAFPKRVVAYLNLGDAYWAEGNSFQALRYYHKYITRMKEKNKSQKIPSYVNQRVEESKKFEKGFIQKYKKVQTLAPIFLKEIQDTKPIEIVPWMQKSIFSLDREDGLIVNVVAYQKGNDVEFVYFVQTILEEGEKIEETQYYQGKISMYKFSYKNQKSTFIMSFDDNRILVDNNEIDETTLTGWNFFNLQEFILDRGYLYFDVYSCESKKGSRYFDAFCYEYKYKFGDNNATKVNYMTKNWYKRWNYKHDRFIYSGDRLSIGYIKNNKKILKPLFVIKSFKERKENGKVVPFTLGGISWSEDDNKIYFDNHEIALACIWRYDLETKELSKIVPEHEAEHPFGFTYKDQEYVVYIENNTIKVATPNEEKQ